MEKGVLAFAEETGEEAGIAFVTPVVCRHLPALI